jgi:pilus assembly protein CpaE
MMTSSHLGSPPAGDPSPTTAPSVAAQSAHASVAVVETHDPTRERLVGLLGDTVTSFATIEELIARLTGTVPVVVVLGPSCANADVLPIAERIVTQYPMIGAILVVDELTTELLQKALRAGVRDVLALTGEAAALGQAVQRVATTLEQPARLSPAVSGADLGDASGTVPQGDLVPLETVNGKVLTVFSTKGGAGKSMLATSLAVTLAQRSDKPVCLVDADLQFGDVAVMLKLTPHHTIVDAVSVLDRMDAALLESLLVTHEPSGLRVMPAPLEPAFADQVGAAEMVAIVEMLRTFCSFVIVDTPAYFNDVVLGLVEVSDRVMLVAGMDIPNIKNVKIGLQTLRLLNTPMEKLLLVLNRANSKVKLDIGEVERTLQLTADALIPSDVVVPQSVNKGEPVVLHSPKSAVSKSILQLAEKFLPADAPKRRR